ncbi:MULTISPECIES: hypothetical protein [Amycolatopsis]|uniref:Uncharacterized protein n=1 Tax=Amycolatopsis thermalba TaxID=944492 RepID=A0ABY4NMN1_9PSEU|nr:MULTISPECIES: hypothetical protein [Amycolatopsis]UQS21765.1 hypothetical protein L1857_02455 [Amycolatopsis thermalba]
MPAPYKPVRTARRPQPITDAEYELLRECRCPRMRGTHAAGHCGSGHDPSSAEREAR